MKLGISVGDIVTVQEEGGVRSWEATVIAIPGMQEFDEAGFDSNGVLVLNTSHRVPVFVLKDRCVVIARNIASDIGAAIEAAQKLACILKHGVWCDSCHVTEGTTTYTKREDYHMVKPLKNPLDTIRVRNEGINRFTPVKPKRVIKRKKVKRVKRKKRLIKWTRKGKQK